MKQFESHAKYQSIKVQNVQRAHNSDPWIGMVNQMNRESWPCKSQKNWLSLRNNRLKFKTARKKITDCFRRIYRIYVKVMKKNRKITTCNWLDLETLGLWPRMPKNLPGQEDSFQGQCKKIKFHSWFSFHWLVSNLFFIFLIHNNLCVSTSMCNFCLITWTHMPDSLHTGRHRLSLLQNSSYPSYLYALPQAWSDMFFCAQWLRNYFNST